MSMSGVVLGSRLIHYDRGGLMGTHEAPHCEARLKLSFLAEVSDV
jgi:hypothetical protein